MGKFKWPGLGRAVKENPVARSILRLVSLGSPVWLPARYEALTREGYGRNAYVFRCVNIVSQACAGVPLIAYKVKGTRQQKRHLERKMAGRTPVMKAIALREAKAKGLIEELEEAPILDLLDRPNPMMSREALVEAWVAFFMLTGNTYLSRVGLDNRPPVEIWPLRPDRTQAIAGNTTANLIAGWEYRAGAEVQRLEPETVLHIKTFNPLDDWYGLSPLAVARRAITMHNAGEDWNVALLQNAAVPSGALVSESSLTDDQFRRLKGEIEENHGGYRNAGRPMVLDGGLKWQTMGLDPADAMWLESDKVSAKKIALIFGVPAPLIGDADTSKYSNYKEARKALYLETVLPLMDRLLGELNWWLAPAFGEGVFLAYDADGIEALREEQDAVYNRTIKAWASNLIKRNEGRGILGFEDDPDQGDKYFSETRPAPAIAPGGGVPPDPAADPKAGKGARPHGRKAAPLTEEAKAAHWQSREDARGPFYEAIAKEAAALLDDEIDRVASAIATTTDAEAAGKAAAKAVKATGKKWGAFYQATYAAVGQAFGELELKDLEARGLLEAKGTGPAGHKEVTDDANDDPAWLNAVLEYVADHSGVKITGIGDRSLVAVQDEIALGIQNGESMPEIAKRIKEVFPAANAKRALVIARTEVINASNAGTYYAAADSGLELVKEWVSTIDNRIRGHNPKDKHTHLGMDGQRQPMAEPFVEPKTGEKLMWPGDTSHGATGGNVIQCRCVQFFDIADE